MMTYLQSNGISTDKSYAHVTAYTDTLDPTQLEQIITCYVNTNKPNTTVTLKHDILRNQATPEPLTLFDKNYNQLQYDSAAGGFTITTEASGRALFLVGSSSGDFYITQLTLSTDDNTELSAPVVFGGLDAAIAGNLPELSIHGLASNNNLTIPDSTFAQMFNVVLGATYLPAAFPVSSRVSIILNDVLVYCGTLGTLSTDGLNIACSLLKTAPGTMNTIGYLIAKPNGQYWSPALASPLQQFTATGDARYTPVVDSRIFIPPVMQRISSSIIMVPADWINGIKITIPKDPAVTVGDVADLYVSIVGTQPLTQQDVHNVVVLSKIGSLPQTVTLPQTLFSGYNNQIVLFADYQLFNSLGQTKGWSDYDAGSQGKITDATILVSANQNNAYANGTDANSAIISVYDSNGATIENSNVKLILDNDSYATFDNSQQEKSIKTDAHGQSHIVVFTDNRNQAEKVALTATVDSMSIGKPYRNLRSLHHLPLP